MRMLTLLLFTLAPILLAEGPEFEVASIKPFDMAKVTTANGTRIPLPAGGPGTADPIHMTQVSSPKGMLVTAFGVDSYRILGGDNATDMFEFSLVVPAGTTKDAVAIMWRNLLISRFGLEYHTEQREFQVDELVVGPKGHKLTENIHAEPPPADPDSGPAKLRVDDHGRPVNTYPGLITMLRFNNDVITATMVGQAQPISALVEALSAQLGHAVVDKTGLTGKYDFSMDFTPPQAPPAPSQGAAGNVPAPLTAADLELDLPTAVQQQLGLRLTKGKGMLDVFAIDKINRTPTEN